jgi:DNA-binding response OmpR family regulator
MPRPSHVLFIEDEDYRNDKMIRFLQAQGLEVTPAGSLTEAVEAAGQRQYGCILLDVMLPPGDGSQDETEALTAGVEFLRRLRGGTIPGADASTPVIVLTGRPEASVEEEMRALGLHAFLNKPESMRVVLDNIRQAIAG